MASDRIKISVPELRAFIYQEICQHLLQSEIQALVYTQDLPPAYLGKPALDVFMKLEMLDRYSVSSLDPLSQMLKKINRNDLAKKVDKFCKSRKNPKKQSSKKDQSLMDAHKHLDYLIDANLKVTKLQTRILLEQIEELKKSVMDRGLVRVQEVVDDAVEVLETTFQRKVERVSSVLTLSRRGDSIDSNGSSGGPTSLSSTSSSEDTYEDTLPFRSPTATMERTAGAKRKSNSLPRDLGKSTHKTPLLPPTPPKKPEQDPSEIVYEEVDPSPPLLSLVPGPTHYYSSVEVTGENRSEQSQMVTGRDGPQQVKPRPPATKPKPRVFRKTTTSATDLTNIDSDYSGGSCTDNTGGSYTDYSGGSYTDYSGGSYTDYSGGSYTDYSGGSYTDYSGGSGDTSTGDSGFVEARKYLRKPLPSRKPHVTPRTYTPLKTEERDVADYYKSRTNDKIDELYELMVEPDTTDGSYVNFASNRS